MDYDVKRNLHEVLGSLPAGVRLVAISKFHPNEYIEDCLLYTSDAADD